MYDASNFVPNGSEKPLYINRERRKRANNKAKGENVNNRFED